MALDAATLALCAEEIGLVLEDARIDKIYQPAKDDVLLSLRTRRETHSLLLSARSGLARVCVTDERYEKPQTPPSFCMLLRKHLTGGRLTGVRAVPGERIMFLDFLCTNEMGDLVDNILAAELMGRYCNIVLITTGPRDREGNPSEVRQPKIVDALKRVDFEDSEIRQLLPGLTYTLPVPRQGWDFLRGGMEELRGMAESSGGLLAEAMRKATTGVGPVVVREALFRAFGDRDMEVSRLGEADWAALKDAVERIRADYHAGGVANLVKREDGKPFEFSFTPLTQYVDAENVRYDGFSEMLEAYYAEKDRQERLRVKSKELRKAAQNMYDRAVRKQVARREEKEESENSDHLRVKGEILTANLYAIRKGDRRVRLENWYDGGELDIELDERLSPQENAQKYFREYKKRQTAAKMLEQLLVAGEKEIAYLETVLYEVDAAEGEAALEEIRAELKSQGYLRHYKPKNKRQKAEGLIQYLSADGFTIYVGRNNQQNESLTLKTARGRDLWFHTKNAPGSHVVVMSEGRDIPLETQNQAAMLAAWHSSQRGSAQVPIDYTIVKNIRKTGDLPVGMVLYDHYETAYITPDAAAVAAIERVK